MDDPPGTDITYDKNMFQTEALPQTGPNLADNNQPNANQQPAQDANETASQQPKEFNIFDFDNL